MHIVMGILCLMAVVLAAISFVIDNTSQGIVMIVVAVMCGIGAFFILPKKIDVI